MRSNSWGLCGLVPIWLIWLGTSGGCERGFISYRAEIQSANADERIRGILAAGQAKDRRAVPLLVDRLEDEDDAVRFFAIIALDKITGQRFGYDYALPAWQRAKAVEQWRGYVRQGGQTASSPAGPDEAVADEAAATIHPRVRGPMQ
jgi:hypothetical protein